MLDGSHMYHFVEVRLADRRRIRDGPDQPPALEVDRAQ
ncbi:MULTISPECIES: hypothetical protein [unclassified Streptomyces]